MRALAVKRGLCLTCSLEAVGQELGLLDLEPGAHLVARGLAVGHLEGVARMRHDHVVVVNHVARLHALVEAARVVELLIQQVHAHLEQRRDGPVHLAVRSLDPEAHVAEAHPLPPVDEDGVRVVLDALRQQVLAARQLHRDARGALPAAVLQHVARDGAEQLVHHELGQAELELLQRVRAVGDAELAARARLDDGKQAHHVVHAVLRGAIRVPPRLRVGHAEEHVVRLDVQVGALHVEEAPARPRVHLSHEARINVVRQFGTVCHLLEVRQAAEPLHVEPADEDGAHVVEQARADQRGVLRNSLHLAHPRVHVHLEVVRADALVVAPQAHRGELLPRVRREGHDERLDRVVGRNLVPQDLLRQEVQHVAATHGAAFHGLGRAEHQVQRHVLHAVEERLVLTHVLRQHARLLHAGDGEAQVGEHPRVVIQRLEVHLHVQPRPGRRLDGAAEGAIPQGKV
mmetsp:Transcript_14922/g.62105  ORF Transcript_14922/g.62105 Transcript_14922/m.62105 type:complete len:458 (+) Transcript_14922:69-1442(+)